RALVRRLLERAGYEVDEAADGREALRTLYVRPPDAVVLDVAMPEIDGWETLKRIRDLTDTPVLMLTARVAETARVRGLSSRADAARVQAPRGARPPSRPGAVPGTAA